MRRSFIFLILFLAGSAGWCPLAAQSLPVGTPVLEDYYRRKQLLGEIDSAVSFMIRPLYPAQAFNRKNVFDPDSLAAGDGMRDSSTVKAVSWLPFSLEQRFNSKFPAGYNDAGFIPAKGYQARVSGGFYARYDHLTVQIRPEVIASPNSGYEGFPSIYPDFTWARYYDFYQGIIDRPERFGSGAYFKLLPGQSSIRLNTGSFSFGASTENLWWGPGQYNSLLMSNTAPGFFHFTLNTTRPFSTPAGSFEMQLIGGVLENSDYAPPGEDRQLNGLPVSRQKSEESRLISGIIATWRPRWINGLFVGYGRVLQAYSDDANIARFIPFATKFMTDDGMSFEKYDQYYSVFGRWLFPSANGEIYFEYGHNNHPYLVENYPNGSGHSRAYIAGVKKLLPLRNNNSQLQVNAEFTELAAPADYLSKPGESWYVNNYIRQGYTHKGKLLGAGAGPGGSVQTFDVSWFRKLRRIGLQIERFQHNVDLYYRFFGESQEPRRHWVDVSATANVNWEFKKLIFNSNLSVIKSLNYQYYLDPSLQTVPWAGGHDLTNIHLDMGLTYRF